MPMSSARLSLLFAAIGHSFIHMFTAFYFTIALTLEDAWALPNHELIALWTLGAVLVGAVALPAGWLANRWSMTGMMVVYFFGLGGSSVAAGLVGGPTSLVWALGGIGLFAAIYHPVGIPWVIRNSVGSGGKILAINGIFGGLGIAMAGIVAGGLSDGLGWRAAFILPGLAAIASGLAMLACVLSGRITEQGPAKAAAPPSSRDDRMRTFAILLLTMFVSGVIFQATQASMPKLFDLRLANLVGDGTLGVGLLVGLVYGVSAFAQIVGGHLADRMPLKTVYVISWVLQVPVLFVAAAIGGLPLVFFAGLLVSLNSASLPAENLLLARYVPAHRHGIAFGLKFVLAFGAGPLAIQLVARIEAATGEFFWLLTVLGVFALVVVAAAVLLPRDRPVPLAVPMPAE